MNATNHGVIQVYDSDTFSAYTTLSIYNGFISLRDSTPSHYLMPTTSGYNSLYLLQKNASYSVTTNAFNFTDNSLTSYSVTLLNSTPLNIADLNYTIEKTQNKSFVLSLPDSNDQNITVSPGDLVSLELP